MIEAQTTYPQVPYIVPVTEEHPQPEVVAMVFGVGPGKILYAQCHHHGATLESEEEGAS